MIIQNGTIEAGNAKGAKYNQETGFRSPASVTWDAPIPCQYVPKQYNRLAQADGGESVTTAAYTAYIDMQPFSAGVVRLRNAKDEVIGIMSVAQAEELYAVNELRLSLIPVENKDAV